LSYALIESAKLVGVEPRAYLRKATSRAVRNPGTATLPRDLKSWAEFEALYYEDNEAPVLMAGLT
jgi:hypothetical protein